MMDEEEGDRDWSITKNPLRQDVKEDSANTPITADMTVSSQQSSTSSSESTKKQSTWCYCMCGTLITLWETYYLPYHYFPLTVAMNSIILAWIYTIIPLQNYWIALVFKTWYWCLLAMVSYVEIFSLMLPDTPDSLYILAYVGGALISPCIHITLWFVNKQNSFVASTVAVVSSFVWTVIVFGIHANTYPYMKYQLRAQRRLQIQRDNNSVGVNNTNAVAWDREGEWAAMYAALVREDGDVTRPTGLFSIFNRPTSIAIPRPTGIYGTPSIVGPSVSVTGTGQACELTNNLRQEVIAAGTPYYPPYYRPSTVPPLPSQSQLSEESESESLSPSHSSNTSQQSTKPMVERFNDSFIVLFNRNNFWFLPRYWDYEYFKKHSHLRHHINRCTIWLQTTSFIACYCIEYTFLCYFTIYFRDHGHTNRRRIGLFIVYIFTITIFRFILKTLGMYCDRYKNVSLSLFFVGEVYGLMYYYTFYRVLFESIKSIPEFAIFQFLHLASEWILYVFRATEFYYNMYDVIMNKLNACCIMLFTNSNKGEGNMDPTATNATTATAATATQNRFKMVRLPHRHWQRFIALDFGIRCTVFIATAIGIIILLTTIQFVPYIKSTNDLAESLKSYNITMLFILAAVILELINAFCMNYFYFLPQGLNFRDQTVHCFALKDFALQALIACTTLFINPVYAFTTMKYAH